MDSHFPKKHNHNSLHEHIVNRSLVYLFGDGIYLNSFSQIFITMSSVDLKYTHYKNIETL